MRFTHLFGKTLRQPPAEAETPSHRLLLRAGMATQVAAGVYAYLPLGWTVMRQIEEIIREEMDREGGQEMLMPSILPIEVYQQSGRDQTMKDILFTLQDGRGRGFALGPTHEELFAEVFKRNVQSYRDLPLLVYQIAPKFRDEPRPRGGLIRLRQFIMKDLYSFDEDWEGLDVSYKKMYDAYQRIFDRCGVPTIPVLADSGAMGGRDTHEFIYLTDYGEDSLLLCPSCGYAANAEVAAFVKAPVHAEEEPKPFEEIDTPGQHTIADLAKFLGVPETKTCKAVFYLATLGPGSYIPGVRFEPDAETDKKTGHPDMFLPTPALAGQHPARGAGRAQSSTQHSAPSTPVPVFVAIRGDMDVNETKLRNALNATELTYMDEEAVQAAGFVPGSAGAVGLVEAGTPTSGEVTGRPIVVADDLVPQERNLVAGANKPDKHLLNTNYGRDWEADIVADVALARSGDLCANCRTPMSVRRGIEMGQVFKLGVGYGEKFGAFFLDAEGKQRPPIMGSYGIGIERLLAAVIEENHDEAGIVWPAELAPFDVHIVAIQPDKEGVRETADRLYEELKAGGLTALYDDRDETPGVKFNDADLLGAPMRVTVSPRNLAQGSLEVKRRTEAQPRLIPVEGAVQAIAAEARS
jgi:prolyl-tRNA synthetase